MLKIENFEVLGWEHAIRGMRNPLNSWDQSDSLWTGFLNTFEEGFPVTYGRGGLNYFLGPNDKALMMKLRNAGTDHRKFMRMIDVYLDILAPLYWWKEFETYRIGVAENPSDIEWNSCSTLHKITAKEFVLDDFSYEHLSCWGAATRKHEGKDIFDEPVSDFMFDYFGVLQATIIALNSAREQFLKRQDKQFWWQIIQLLPSSYNQNRTVKVNYEVLANLYKSRRNHKLDEWHVMCDWIEGLPYSELITGKVDDVTNDK